MALSGIEPSAFQLVAQCLNNNAKAGTFPRLERDVLTQCSIRRATYRVKSLWPDAAVHYTRFASNGNFCLDGDPHFHTLLLETEKVQ
jgi:hypothetical protein